MEEDRDEPWNLHACKVCPYRSKLAFEMYKHIRLHGRRSKTDTFTCDTKTPEMYECEFCEFETNLKVDLTEHFRVFHEEREDNEEMENILKCRCCKHCDFNTHSLLIFTRHIGDCNILSGSNLIEDQRKIHEMNDFFATENGKQPGSVFLKVIRSNLNRYLKQHISEHSNIEVKPWIKCAYCAFKTKENNRLKCHCTHKHTKSANIKSHKIKNKSDLKERISEDYIIWFNCGQCSFKTRRSTFLQRHILFKHNLGSIGWHQCDQCTYKTKKKGDLKQHFSSKHNNLENINWFSCDQCDYKSRTMRQLNRHNVRHHMDPINIRWLKCNQCAYKTKTKSDVKRHILYKHTLGNFSWIKCDQCAYKTKKKEYLKQHILFKHTDLISWFKCDQCLYKFKTKSALGQHIVRKHINQKTFTWLQCDQCAYKTKVKVYLKQHVLRNHIDA